MAVTKKDLEVEVKVLKEEVRRLRKEAKSVEAALEGLDSEAHGVIKNFESGHYSLVRVLFDVESGKAAIENVKDIGKSIAMASSKVKHAVIDTLVAVNKESNRR